MIAGSAICFIATIVLLLVAVAVYGMYESWICLKMFGKEEEK